MATKRGRPSLYRDEFPELARKHCLLGATDDNLASLFNVSVATINAWKIEHSEFLESLNAGKAEADANIAERLYQRAMGYSHPAVKVFLYQGAPVVVPYTEHYPPDTTAAIFWLKNRKKEQWRANVTDDDPGDGGIVIKGGLPANDGN